MTDDTRIRAALPTIKFLEVRFISKKLDVLVAMDFARVPAEVYLDALFPTLLQRPSFAFDGAFVLVLGEGCSRHSVQPPRPPQGCDRVATHGPCSCPCVRAAGQAGDLHQRLHR